MTEPARGAVPRAVQGRLVVEEAGTAVPTIFLNGVPGEPGAAREQTASRRSVGRDSSRDR